MEPKRYIASISLFTALMVGCATERISVDSENKKLIDSKFPSNKDKAKIAHQGAKIIGDIVDSIAVSDEEIKEDFNSSYSDLIPKTTTALENSVSPEKNEDGGTEVVKPDSIKGVQQDIEFSKTLNVPTEKSLIETNATVGNSVRNLDDQVGGLRKSYDKVSGTLNLNEEEFLPDSKMEKKLISNSLGIKTKIVNPGDLGAKSNSDKTLLEAFAAEDKKLIMGIADKRNSLIENKEADILDKNGQEMSNISNSSTSIGMRNSSRSVSGSISNEKLEVVLFPSKDSNENKSPDLLKLGFNGKKQKEIDNLTTEPLQIGFSDFEKSAVGSIESSKLQVSLNQLEAGNSADSEKSFESQVSFVETQLTPVEVKTVTNEKQIILNESILDKSKVSNLDPEKISINDFRDQRNYGNIRNFVGINSGADKNDLNPRKEREYQKLRDWKAGSRDQNRTADSSEIQSKQFNKAVEWIKQKGRLRN